MRSPPPPRDGPSPAVEELLIARQPILDRAGRLIGYELLYRSSHDNRCEPTDPVQATGSVIDTAILIGLDSLLERGWAFVNFDREALLRRLPFILPPSRLVPEIIESVQPDEEVLQACRELRQAGYQIALDDYGLDNQRAGLLPVVTIVKVDVSLTGTRGAGRLASEIAGKARLLAEKVETQQDFTSLLQQGYELFQGYFFSRPHMFSTRCLSGNRLAHLRLLHEVASPEADVARLEGIIKADPALVHKLLRYVNSALFHRASEVRSIRQAIVLLGEEQLQRWITVVALARLANGKPEALLVDALLRARLCELLAPLLGWPDQTSAFFLLGLYSLIDALLDRPKEEVLATVPLARDIRDTLLGVQRAPAHLQAALNLATAWERADLDWLAVLANRNHVPLGQLTSACLEAARWVSRMLRYAI